jgi:hypothetical protein
LLLINPDQSDKILKIKKVTLSTDRVAVLLFVCEAVMAWLYCNAFHQQIHPVNFQKQLLFNENIITDKV